MADYRKMTVESLRGLARDVLGPGHSKRTKLELVKLLEDAAGGKVLPAKATPARPAATAKPAARSKAGPPKAPKAVTPAKPAPRARAAAEPKPAARAEKPAAKPAARPKAAASTGPARAQKGVKAERAAEAKAAGEQRAAARAEGAAVEAAPGAEGYFVARVRGEDAVRDAPHPLTETSRDVAPPAEALAAANGEDLGELPWGYGDDTFMALPRDPRTLFLFWDFAGETLAEAFAGLEGGRAELRILARAGERWEEVRRVEFALESRGFYVHDLDPGRVYRAEIHAVDRRGVDRVVGQASNDMMLPPLGPSPVIDDRFIRIPWEMSLGRLLGPGHAGGPFSDEARALLARLSDWSRFGGGGGSAGGIGGAPGGGRGPGMGGGSGAGMAGSGSGRGP